MILRPYSRCDGVISSKSSMFDDKCVSGLSFISALISVTIVCRVSIDTEPFLYDVLVSPMKHSQIPPYHGARACINLNSVPTLLYSSCMADELKNFIRWLVAVIYVVALSDIITFGKGFRLVNLRKTCRNECVDKSNTTSR